MRRIRELVAPHADVLVAFAVLVVVGWTLPAGDRFGYLVAIAVGTPWAILVLQRRAES